MIFSIFVCLGFDTLINKCSAYGFDFYWIVWDATLSEINKSWIFQQLNVFDFENKYFLSWLFMKLCLACMNEWMDECLEYDCNASHILYRRLCYHKLWITIFVCGILALLVHFVFDALKFRLGSAVCHHNIIVSFFIFLFSVSFYCTFKIVNKTSMQIRRDNFLQRNKFCLVNFLPDIMFCCSIFAVV